MARVPIRKPGRKERFASPARRLFETGRALERLATVIGGILRYDHPGDEGAM